MRTVEGEIAWSEKKNEEGVKRVREKEMTRERGEKEESR